MEKSVVDFPAIGLLPLLVDVIPLSLEFLRLQNVPPPILIRLKFFLVRRAIPCHKEAFLIMRGFLIKRAIWWNQTANMEETKFTPDK